MSGRLEQLRPGQEIVFGGDRVVSVSDELAASFRPGDRLVVVQTSGDLLHIPESEHALVERAVGAAVEGFAGLATVSDEQITDFFDTFAARLADDDVFQPILEANDADVASARERGRSTTRLELGEKMRADMIAGLREWRDASVSRDEVIERIDHLGWSVEARRAPLGVVGFVFEGRPNVFADACGVLRSGNSVVFRIGSDALGTARAIVAEALAPALADAGLPAGAVRLIDSPSRSAGHALFSDGRLSLAVARGSGAAVAQLGAVAAQCGVAVSLHGTGGAWIVTGEGASAEKFAAAVHHSLDRKVCNTLNVAAILRHRADEFVPRFLDALDAAAAERATSGRLHVIEGSEGSIPPSRFDTVVPVERADGVHDEPFASILPVDGLAMEWEWENSPEVTVVVVDSVAEAIELSNRYSPRFTASLISDDPAEQHEFSAAIDAPFVGDGFTRWVDGQYALQKPELGLSNWENGRMLGRGGILSGDSVFTVRYRARIDDIATRR